MPINDHVLSILRGSAALITGPLGGYLSESFPAPLGGFLCSVSGLSGRAWPRSQTEKSAGGGVPTCSRGTLESHLGREKDAESQLGTLPPEDA